VLASSLSRTSSAKLCALLYPAKRMGSTRPHSTICADSPLGIIHSPKCGKGLSVMDCPSDESEDAQ
jgi:hypothetical protein